MIPHRLVLVFFLVLMGLGVLAGATQAQTEADAVQPGDVNLQIGRVRVEEGSDYLKLAGGKVRGAEIETYNDHRMAMSFAVVGLKVPGIRILGERCVEKSFPGFWETWKQLYENSR